MGAQEGAAEADEVVEVEEGGEKDEELGAEDVKKIMT